MVNVRVAVDVRRSIIVLSVSTFAIICSSLILQVVAVTHGADHIFGLLPLLNIDREGNIPAWFSSFLLASAALIAWSLSVQLQQGEPRHPGIIGWRVTSLLLLSMSMDEVGQVHERVGDFVQPFLPDVTYLHFGWVAVGLPAVLILAPFAIRFLLAIPRRTGRSLLFAAAVFLCGALGVELITSAYVGGGGQKVSASYFILSHVEEALEMVGVLLAIRGLLKYQETLESERSAPYPARVAAAHTP